jgi:hypothetical protein
MTGLMVRHFPILFFPQFFFFSCPLTRELAPILEHRADYSEFLDLSQAVGLLGRVISSSQGLYLNTGQHTDKLGHTLTIHAQGGFRARNHGLRAIEDCSCLRPLGYHDRLQILITTIKLKEIQFTRPPAFLVLIKAITLS